VTRHPPQTQRLIAVGDVHGRFDLLRRLLEEEIRFDGLRDRLVFMGDYIDRGPASRAVVFHLLQLRDAWRDRLVFLKGNHEAMARAALADADERAMALWLLNGGEATVASFGGLDAARRVLVPFIEGLSLYHETETHLFVHAGLLPDEPPERTPEEVLLWSRDLRPHASGKTVVVGHSIQPEVRLLEGVVAVDTGAFLTGVLSAYDVISGRVYATRP